MYVRNDASKIVIQYNSWQDNGMPGTSVFRLRSSVLYLIEYWVTGKEVYNHNIYCFG